jgi:hypothetical protein
MKKSETKKYIAVIDPKAGSGKGFVYEDLTAQNLIEAMNEASELMDDSVYLIDLYEKMPGGDKEKVFYKPVLRNRGYGWNAAERDSNILDTLAFYYKYHNVDNPITSIDIQWVA